MRLFFQKSLSSESVPLIQELWEHFYDNYFNNNMYYEYLDMDQTDLVWLKTLILGLFVGLSIASFATLYDKRTLGNMVRRLIATDCLSPEKAQTLEQLGYARSSIARHAVRKSVSLRRVVRCREEEEFLAEQEQRRTEHEEKRKLDRSLPRFRDAEYRFDLEHDHFYIPEDMKYMADVKFERKGTTLFAAILFTVLLAIGYVILLVNLPSILDILNDFVGGFSYTGNGQAI